ncbi:MAG TPA: malto-oligosyltrehalose trehalohydrolase [Candidatus Eisenbacteria bacterium]|nr:malto-oligosyltrehalose trehalohydrolase [Candidatus Eisenbacteria bacterium]
MNALAQNLRRPAESPAARARERDAPGATCGPDGVFFRVWAPKRRRAEVVFEAPGPAPLELERGDDGWFAGHSPKAGPGTRYRYRLDGGGLFPDPYSRFQPAGPHGPSEVIDPAAYVWKDSGWTGLSLKGQVYYELHVGCFTSEGTFDAAARHLGQLRELGVTAVEIMPVAEFPGRWNWGYDGVLPYAPFHGYGDAEAFKRFVDAAHAAGLGVILDVVYNHLGPDGNYLREFSDDYFTDRYRNDWGPALNFDGPASRPVREYFVRNAAYWISEFHLDGLRLDATQNIEDAGDPHVIAEIAEAARAAAARARRKILVIAENELQDTRLLVPAAEGGMGLDSLWNDDFHHSARVAATGEREAYYTDYRGAAQEFVSLFKRGFLYQGQYYRWQHKNRGAPVTGEPAASFVNYLENHDQIANTRQGLRLHERTSPGRWRALTAVLLLGPGTPLLFMGQEFGASARFLFFADHHPGLSPAVLAGRREFLSQFPSAAGADSQASLADPAHERTFLDCRLDWAERAANTAALSLHRDLLKLRREEPLLAAQDRHTLDGAVVGPQTFVIRWFAPDGRDTLLAVNLGAEQEFDPAPEPLLAVPRGSTWKLAWASESARYGGPGERHPLSRRGWVFPAESAVYLKASKGEGAA